MYWRGTASPLLNEINMNAYEMCIANIARKIRSNKGEPEFSAFDYAHGLAVGFCKSYDEVVLDIVNFKD
jgi:hypothetical protein